MEDRNKNAAFEEEITLKELFHKIGEWYRYLLSKYIIILAAGILGGALGILYAFNERPIYIANLTFALEDEQSSGMGGALGLAGQLGLDVGGGGGGVFVGANLIELFKSRTMVEKTLLTEVKDKGETISLAEMFIRDNKWREDWKDTKFKNIQFSPNADRGGFTRVQDSILEKIYRSLAASGLSVSQIDKKVSIISIEVKSTDEVFSKNFTESLVEIVSDFYIETKSEKAKINMTILQKQLDSIRGELSGSIKGVAVASDRTFGLNPALEVKRIPVVRKHVDVQANTAILTELVRQTELSKVTLRKETPLIQIIDRPIYPLQKVKFGKLKGLILGGLLGGFFSVFFLALRRIMKQNSNQRV